VGITAGSREVPRRKPVARDSNSYNNNNNNNNTSIIKFNYLMKMLITTNHVIATCSWLYTLQYSLKHCPTPRSNTQHSMKQLIIVIVIIIIIIFTYSMEQSPS
jgi:hypothetical protein